MASKVQIRNVPTLGWLRIKDSKGRMFTVQNFGYRFTSSKHSVFDYGEDQTLTTHYSFTIEPASIISIYGDAQNVSLLLSRMVHGNLWDSNAENPRMFQLGSLAISPAQVKTEAKRCLDVGSYRREGKRVISLFWCIDTFLKREKLNKDSKWITVVMGGKDNASLKPYMKDTSEKLMHKHLRSVFDSREEEMKKELKEEILKELTRKQKKKR